MFIEAEVVTTYSIRSQQVKLCIDTLDNFAISLFALYGNGVYTLIQTAVSQRWR